MIQLSKADIGKHFVTRSGAHVVVTKFEDNEDLVYPYRASFLQGDGDYSLTPDGRELASANSELDLMAYVGATPQMVTIYDKPAGFVTKDTGARATFDGGMVRDTAAGKMRPDLAKDGPMFLRWVMLMTRGAVKYAARNWMRARGQTEYNRFHESADRHFEIWSKWRKEGINIENPDNPTREPLTEDHAAAVYFNINGVEYVHEVAGITTVEFPTPHSPFAPTP